MGGRAAGAHAGCGAVRQQKSAGRLASGGHAGPGVAAAASALPRAPPLSASAVSQQSSSAPDAAIQAGRQHPAGLEAAAAAERAEEQAPPQQQQQQAQADLQAYTDEMLDAVIAARSVVREREAAERSKPSWQARPLQAAAACASAIATVLPHAVSRAATSQPAEKTRQGLLPLPSTRLATRSRLQARGPQQLRRPPVAPLTRLAAETWR